MKDIVRLGLVMGFCSAAASAMAENSWTKETWDDTYAIPSDALSGMPTSGQNADAFTDFEMTGARPSTVSGGRVWTFAEPKDISSVQILTDGQGYIVSSIAVTIRPLFRGASERMRRARTSSPLCV